MGESTRSLDRFFRTLGFRQLAEANLEHLSGETKTALQAYAEGVNAFLTERSGPLPLEFQILRYEPEPWSPADSLLWGRLMALRLSENWRDELSRSEEHTSDLQSLIRISYAVFCFKKKKNTRPDDSHECATSIHTTAKKT